MANSREFNLDAAVAILTRTPATLEALLRGMPDLGARANEGRGKQGKDSWSAFDIVGHLIVGERTDWIPRARIILQNGEGRPFDLFGRFAQEKQSQGKSLDELLDQFSRLRQENLSAL